MSKFQEYMEAASIGKKISRIEAKKWQAPAYKKSKYDSNEEESEIKKLLGHLKGIASISYEAPTGELNVEVTVPKSDEDLILKNIKSALKGTPYSTTIIDFWRQ